MSALTFMLDTNIVSDMIRNRGSRATDHLATHGQAVCLSIIVAGELRYGALKRGSARLLSDVEGVLARIPVMPFEPAADVSYAQLRDHLTRRGTPIGPMDMLIAAHALALDLTLVTANIREFSRVPALRVENWLD